MPYAEHARCALLDAHAARFNTQMSGPVISDNAVICLRHGAWVRHSTAGRKARSVAMGTLGIVH
jgi:hypothetical protein